MKYGIFSVRDASYPAPAEGWGENGVYTPRRVVYGDTKMVISDDGNDGNEGSARFECRCFRETEETGWGVYDYVEAPEFTFEAEYGDFEISAVFDAPLGSLKISALVDGILYRDVSAEEEDGRAVVTLRAAASDKTMSLRFFVADGERVNAGLDTVCTLSLRSLSAKRLERECTRKKLTVFIASDSTAQSYGDKNYPQTGWGQMLHKYFKDADFAFEYIPEGATYSLCRAYELPGIIVENRSIGGRSSRSFMLEGKWSELLFRCQRGDFILIQFGHNDSTKARPNRYTSVEEFREYIKKYAISAMARGVTPVLVTPVSRRSINPETGEFNISFPEHRAAVISAARELDIPYIDLGLESRSICGEICETLGADATKSLYLWTKEGEYSGVYAGGSRDDTHLCRRGALIFAGAVAKLIEKSPDERLAAIKSKLDPSLTFTRWLPTRSDAEKWKES